MARLFKAGTNAALQEELVRRIRPEELSRIQTRDEYDSWLFNTVESSCWEPYSRNGLADDRWAYFAKVVNIVVYEVIANRELFSEADWQRLRPFLHIPVDATITYHLSKGGAELPWSLGAEGHDEGSVRRRPGRSATPRTRARRTADLVRGGVVCMTRSNFAVEQTAGSRSLACGCSPRR